MPITFRTGFPEVALQIGLAGVAGGVTMRACWLIQSRQAKSAPELA